MEIAWLNACVTNAGLLGRWKMGKYVLGVDGLFQESEFYTWTENLDNATKFSSIDEVLNYIQEYAQYFRSQRRNWKIFPVTHTSWKLGQPLE